MNALGKLMRNWDLARFATLAEIGASLGVIISVIYLGIQIQGSNKQLRAQSYNDTLEMLHKPLELIVQDQGLADIVLRANRCDGLRYSYAVRGSGRFTQALGRPLAIGTLT